MTRCRLRNLDVEEGGEDLCGGRRRGGPTVAAVLDHRADDEFRVVRGAVAAPPRLVLQAEVAGERDDLFGRARLTRDRDGEVAEHRIGGPEGEVRGLPQPLLDDLERRRVDDSLAL